MIWSTRINNTCHDRNLIYWNQLHVWRDLSSMQQLVDALESASCPFKQKLREWTCVCVCARLGEWACAVLSIILRWCAARALWVADGHFLGGGGSGKHALCKICSCPRRRAFCVMWCLLHSLFVPSEELIPGHSTGIPRKSNSQLSRRDLLWLPPEMDAPALNLEKWERAASTHVNNCPGFSRPYSGNLIPKAWISKSFGRRLESLTYTAKLKLHTWGKKFIAFRNRSCGMIAGLRVKLLYLYLNFWLEINVRLTMSKIKQKF